MNKGTLIFLAFLVFFTFAGLTARNLITSVQRDANLAATYLNDSAVVDVEQFSSQSGVVGTGNNPPNGSSQIVNGSVVNLGATTQTSSSSQPVIVFDDTSTTTTTVTPPVIPVVVVTTTPSNTEGNSNGGSNTSTTTATTGNEITLTIEEILTTLLGSQGIVSISNSGANSDGVGNDGGSGGGLFGVFGGGINDGIRFFSDRIRSALNARGVFSIIIPNRNDILNNRGGKKFSQSDFALFVAQQVLRNEYIEDVVYLNGVVTLKYKASGRLLGFIPLRYTLTVRTSFANNTLKDITLKYPWYSFLMSKGVSETVLKARIQAEVMQNIDGFSNEYDVVTRAFVGMSDVVALQFGDY